MKAIFFLSRDTIFLFFFINDFAEVILAFCAVAARNELAGDGVKTVAHVKMAHVNLIFLFVRVARTIAVKRNASANRCLQFINTAPREFY